MNKHEQIALLYAAKVSGALGRIEFIGAGDYALIDLATGEGFSVTPTSYGFNVYNLMTGKEGDGATVEEAAWESLK